MNDFLVKMFGQVNFQKLKEKIFVENGMKVFFCLRELFLFRNCLGMNFLGFF